MPDMLIIRFVVAFVVVLALIGLTAWLFRRFAGSGATSWARNSENRVEVLETVTVDPKRRLVLLRCDDDEHLVLVGGNTDVVVSGPRTFAPNAAHEMYAPMGHEAGNQLPRDFSRPPAAPQEPPFEAPPVQANGLQQRPRLRDGQAYVNGHADSGRTLHRGDHQPEPMPPVHRSIREDHGLQPVGTQPDFQDEFADAVAQVSQPVQAPPPPRQVTAQAAPSQARLEMSARIPEQRLAAAPVRSKAPQRPATQARPRAKLAHDPAQANPAASYSVQDAGIMEDDLTAALAETMAIDEVVETAPPAQPAVASKPRAPRPAAPVARPARSAVAPAPTVAAPAAPQTDARDIAATPRAAAQPQATAPKAAATQAPKPADEKASVQNDNPAYDDMAKRLEAALKPLDSPFELKSAN